MIQESLKKPEEENVKYLDEDKDEKIVFPEFQKTRIRGLRNDAKPFIEPTAKT